MAESGTVCSMCGDIGFPDKLFQCTRCVARFQHSYCSNYYEEEPSPATAEVCDWCLSKDRSGVQQNRSQPSLKKQGGKDSGSRSGYASGDKVKKSGDEEESGSRGKSSSGSSSSSKHAGRRYKLLKDVLC